MKMDNNLVSRLEALARITLSPDSAARIASQLDSIVSYIDRIAEVDTSDVPPAPGTLDDDRGLLRNDEVKPGLSLRDALEQAPDASRNFFRAPRVIGGKEDR